MSITTRVETPLVQIQRHARQIDRAAKIIDAVQTQTPVDLTLIERALFEVDQAARKARRALAAARAEAQQPFGRIPCSSSP